MVSTLLASLSFMITQMSGSCTQSLGAETDSSTTNGHGRQLGARMPQEPIQLFQRDAELEGEVGALPGLGLLFAAFPAADRGAIDAQRLGQSLLGVSDDDAPVGQRAR
jgi:hypothetical protein